MSGSEPSAPPGLDGVAHRHVAADGLRLHVADAGAGEPVVLLHGWPQHWWAWRGVIPRLAADHRVLAPDLRGFGWSQAPPEGYDKTTLADDVVALLDVLGLRRVLLVGHDWGGWVGFLLALAHPERVAGYLAINMITPWPSEPGVASLGDAARLSYQAVLAAPGLGARLLRHTDLVARMIRAGAQHPGTWSAGDLALYADRLREPARARASVRLYRTFLTRELVPYLRGRYADRRLTVPTLLLFGTHDRAIDHRRLGTWRAHADVMAVERRDDSGHFLPEELPGVVADRVAGLAAGRAPASLAGA